MCELPTTSPLLEQGARLSPDRFNEFTSRGDIRSLLQALKMSAGALDSTFSLVYSFTPLDNGDMICNAVSSNFSEYTLGQIDLRDTHVYFQLK